jgi:NTE family protein
MAALVLGGGGVAGVAWEIGVLAGLADAGVDVTDAHLIVGTSAGSVVGAQVTSGVGLEELFERQVSPPPGKNEIMAVLDEAVFADAFRAMRDLPTAGERRAALGRRALEAATVSEKERRAVIEWRLPSHQWAPDRDLRVVAVEVDTGDLTVFDRDSGVSLVDAVAASCAVPIVWPPTTIGAKRYIDGGVRTATNADLAADHDTILVLAPLDDLAGLGDPDVQARIDALVRDGRALVIKPDAASVAAIGMNPLDPGTREPAARAGRGQGRAVAGVVRRHSAGPA